MKNPGVPKQRLREEKRSEKSGHEKTLAKIVFITAILNLIKEILLSVRSGGTLTVTGDHLPPQKDTHPITMELGK